MSGPSLLLLRRLCIRLRTAPTRSRPLRPSSTSTPINDADPMAHLLPATWRRAHDFGGRRKAETPRILLHRPVDRRLPAVLDHFCTRLRLLRRCQDRASPLRALWALLCHRGVKTRGNQGHLMATLPIAGLRLCHRAVDRSLVGSSRRASPISVRRRGIADRPCRPVTRTIQWVHLACSDQRSAAGRRSMVAANLRPGSVCLRLGRLALPRPDRVRVDRIRRVSADKA